MQPDLLSAQQEEEPPEAGFPQDLIRTESSSVPEVPQPEPSLVTEVVGPTSAAAQKKGTKLNIAAMALGWFVILLFLSLGWVGYWAYTLNTELMTTQGQLVALQAEHTKL